MLILNGPWITHFIKTNTKVCHTFKNAIIYLIWITSGCLLNRQNLQKSQSPNKFEQRNLGEVRIMLVCNFDLGSISPTF